MSDAPTHANQNTSTVNLVRTSHPWTKADSAAGFVLRYLTPMRKQLIAMLGTEAHADEALKLLLAHLVQAGFGEHKRGKLRDFIVRGLRSAAKSRAADLTESPELDLESLTPESKSWLMLWREGLLERAWRSLERQEHAQPDVPVYSVLHLATANPKATPEMLAVQINTEGVLKVDKAKVAQTLPQARALFAQLVADEVAETLEAPNAEDVKREINLLGLGRAFSGMEI